LFGVGGADTCHLDLCRAADGLDTLDVARTGAAYAEQLAQALVTRAALPGFDPQALEAAGLPELPAALGDR
jgi:hypothetical protein